MFTNSVRYRTVGKQSLLPTQYKSEVQSRIEGQGDCHLIRERLAARKYPSDLPSPAALDMTATGYFPDNPGNSGCDHQALDNEVNRAHDLGNQLLGDRFDRLISSLRESLGDQDGMGELLGEANPQLGNGDPMRREFLLEVIHDNPMKSFNPSSV